MLLPSVKSEAFILPVSELIAVTRFNSLTLPEQDSRALAEGYLRTHYKKKTGSTELVIIQIIIYSRFRATMDFNQFCFINITVAQHI